MNKIKTILWTVVALAVVLGIGYGTRQVLHSNDVKGGANGTESTDPNGNLSTNFIYIENSSAHLVDQYFAIGSSTAAGVAPTTIGNFFSKTEVISSGSCYTSTTTLFAVQNPLNATSTASVTITGIGQASSTNLTIGTSSPLVASGYRQNDLSGTLVYNLGPAIATSTQFYIRSGQLTGLGTGQFQAGTSTSQVVPSIVVGPREFVGAFSTSTYPISGVAANTGNFVPGLSTCSFKIDWVQ